VTAEGTGISSGRADALSARAMTSWETEREAGPRHYNYAGRGVRRTPAQKQALADRFREVKRATDEHEMANTRRWDHQLPDGSKVIVTAQYYGPWQDCTVYSWSIHRTGSLVRELWTPREHRDSETPKPRPPHWHTYAVPGRVLPNELDFTEIDADFPAADVAA